MSCRDGERCREGRNRLRALLVLGAMLIVFVVLSAFSFLGSRNQVTPDQFHFNNFSANDGKRVFQAYNCMDCHTVVGNGAYFAPDLTEEYRKAGPAWLAAFLPSAGHWPSEAALKVQLANAVIAADAGTASLDEYYAKFAGARDRVTRRQGDSLMPNLPLTHEEVEKLIAYLKYTSAMDTEGWPPKVESGSLEHRVALAHGMSLASQPVASARATAPSVAPSSAATMNPVEQGKQLAGQYGCSGCHSTGTQRLVGPGWSGLYGSQVKLTDGSTASADDAWLARKILHADATTVAGYPKGVMPNFSGQLTDADVKALVAYIHSLEKSR
jgi:mono/diheme cytochrome c family protein